MGEQPITTNLSQLCVDCIIWFAFRYTEWVRWDGAKLLPIWDNLIGRELYSHVGDDGTDFDGFENVNEVNSAPPEVVVGLQTLLHAIVANQTRLPSFTRLQ